MPTLTACHARQVLDSRGRPTVEVELAASDGSQGAAIAPSGASTGAAEAHELRDGDPARYDGDGVERAVRHVRETIGPALAGLDPTDQHAVDQRLRELDGSPQKTQLGGNAITAVSLAAAHLGAAVRKLPLYEHLHGELERARPRTPGAPPLAPCRAPLPMTNMISGGKHAGGNLDLQDVLIIPHGATHYDEALEWIVRVYRRLGEMLTAAGFEGRLVGDEGGFGPRLPSNEAALKFVVRAVEAARLRPGEQVSLALDVAASHFFTGGGYRLASEGRELSAAEMIDLVDGWTRRFPVASIEDPLAEDDWPAWTALAERCGGRVQLVGDDLFATQPDRIRRGVAAAAANCVLVKVNQVGALSDAFDAIHLARAAGWTFVVSARSGETEDWSIADLAVASGCAHIKIGSIVRSERLAKYNRLLRIAERIGGEFATPR